VAVNHLDGEQERSLLESINRDVDELISAEGGQTSNNRRFITVRGDIARPETGLELIAQTVAAFGRLDIFVSNAGVCQFAEFMEYAEIRCFLFCRKCSPCKLSISPSLLDKTISTNLSGAFYATQAAARQMAFQQTPSGGSIIGISSISALVGGGQQAHYTPTKAGISSLMQSCAVALGKHGIRCNALLPGTIRTQLNEEDLRDEAKRQYMERRIPLGRLGTTQDMAGPAVFLGSEALSGYVVSSPGELAECAGSLIRRQC
jgi:L-rhamnose 1-dehydrogenase